MLNPVIRCKQVDWYFVNNRLISMIVFLPIWKSMIKPIYQFQMWASFVSIELDLIQGVQKPRLFHTLINSVCTGCPKSHAPSLTCYIIRCENSKAIKEVCVDRVTLHNVCDTKHDPNDDLFTYLSEWKWISSKHTKVYLEGSVLALLGVSKFWVTL